MYPTRLGFKRKGGGGGGSSPSNPSQTLGLQDGNWFQFEDGSWLVLADVPGLTSKPTPAQNDLLLVVDVSTNINKHISVANLGLSGDNLAADVFFESTLEATTPSFDIQNIPQTHQNLYIEALLRTDPSVQHDFVYATINNDSTDANYYFQDHYYDNGTGNTGSEGNDRRISYCIGASAVANSFAYTKIYLNNYTNTSLYKTMTSQSGMHRDAFGGSVSASTVHNNTLVYLANTDAVNRITIAPGGADGFVAGSWLRLVLEKI